MLVTQFGMVTAVKLLQLSKTRSQILVMLFGMVTEVKLLQP